MTNEIRVPMARVDASLALAPSMKMSLTLLLLAISCSGGCTSDRAKIDETKKRGNQIIQALERFRADQGHYPTSLTDLVPKYIHTLPSATWGTRTWKYAADANGFTLSVDESVHTGDGQSRWLRYQGEKLGWQTGD